MTTPPLTDVPVRTADDAMWAAGLRAAFASYAGTWSLHRADGGGIRPLVGPPGKALSPGGTG